MRVALASLRVSARWPGAGDHPGGMRVLLACSTLDHKFEGSLSRRRRTLFGSTGTALQCSEPTSCGIFGKDPIWASDARTTGAVAHADTLLFSGISARPSRRPSLKPPLRPLGRRLSSQGGCRRGGRAQNESTGSGTLTSISIIAP